MAVEQTEEYDPDEVRSNPELSPEEKETIIRFSKSDEYADMFSEQASVVRAMIQHSDIEVTDVGRRDNGDITSAWARVPVGLLKLMRNPRTNNNPSSVVSKQEKTKWEEDREEGEG